MVELSIVVPTLNERGNIIPFIKRVNSALGPCDYEIIFVDDNSSDGTLELLSRLTDRMEGISLIHRVERTGLSSAVIEGMCAAQAELIAVMDADLQHDEKILPRMVDKIKNDNLEIVIGCRSSYHDSSRTQNFWRRCMSSTGNCLTRWVLGRAISDPLSGYFLVRRNVVYEVIPSLSANEFKILFDIISSLNRPIKFGEMRYTFRERHSGRSKLSKKIIIEHGHMLCREIIRRFLRRRKFTLNHC